MKQAHTPSIKKEKRNAIIRKFIDLTGMVFERLTVLSRDYTKKQKSVTYWWCQCSCENKTIKSIQSRSLRKGLTKSCGCLQKEIAIELNKSNKKKFNTYNLCGEYGIGYTLKGEEFYFDLEDYELIKNYCWSLRNEYVIAVDIDGSRKNVNMHRLVMNAKENEKVDHKFHNKKDNRKDKLRLVSVSQNSMNRSLSKNNTSGVKGVGWDKREMNWIAYIGVNKKFIRLGKFNNFEDAVLARKNAENKYQKEYSYDNTMNTENLA